MMFLGAAYNVINKFSVEFLISRFIFIKFYVSFCKEPIKNSEAKC